MEQNPTYSSRSIFWYLLNIALVIAIGLGVVSICAVVRRSNAVVPSRTITISGEGKTTVAPDLATLSFAVISQGSDAAMVQTQNTSKINKAIEFVKAQGIAAEDIKTTGYNLYPRYRYDQIRGDSSISGYELTQTVVIKIHDLAKVSAVIGGLPAAGINQISSLQYSLENPEAQRDSARAEAFKHAYEKARAMAKQNGVRLARVISFSESSDNAPYPPIYYERALGAAKDSVSTPTIEPGSEEVTIRVSVIYEIR